MDKKPVWVMKKNKNYVAGGNQPYFRVVLAPKEGETEWKEVAAFWLKEKNGEKYYTGSPNAKVKLIFSDDKENIDPNDIPFD